ncbi:30S ribosomal protein S15p [Candidatus Mancarchaeum acidiphilum]|uniref:30S ribosomal protein S15 n=1 Tax=Candidatus Mancarchaeum acidiphilum TaxID=1920749 RepID=A0A218NM10_9ARCH|nr:30S ribosomal protein S15 [Candidatus Mancarchaeum acidiphilum]ASI13496.1 30S ribosomal protein S15p [Candidatus Mancarchaeum acidiphilum]
MAKLHTKRHGKSGSLKPIMEKGQLPEGLKVNKEEIEKLIVDYAQHGMPPALIGETLKKEKGVGYIKQITGKRLMQILKDNNMKFDLPPDLMDLMKKAVRLNKHMANNHMDVHNKIRLKRVESKIWRLTKYYINEGVLPEGWRYNAQQAELLIKRV